MLPLLLLLASAPPANAVRNLKAEATAVITCTAVSRRQVEAAIARTVDSATQENTSAASTCVWSAADTEVTISVQQLQPNFDLPAELHTLKEAFPGSTVREVSVGGGQAFALELSGAGAQLHIVRGAREYVLISVLGGPQAARNLAAASDLARALLPSLVR